MPDRYPDLQLRIKYPIISLILGEYFKAEQVTAQCEMLSYFEATKEM